VRRLGAFPRSDDRCDFAVWAPDHDDVAVEVDGARYPLARDDDGTHSGEGPTGDYAFVLGDRVLPDPCSRLQPNGIDGPSRPVDASSFEIAPFDGVPLDDLVVYELHVGTFSAEGTFDGVIPRLRPLRELGVTAIEVMPVATFPGTRNWGYDGVYTFAPHPVYSGPDGLARLVDAAHREGLGVILDVVYNHIGPGAERIGAFGRYFTDRFHTFWGDALDYSQRGVREWAIQNAEQWIRDYRVDGLRLDAVHSVFDDSDPHVLRELRDRVKALNPNALVISEMGPEDFRPLREWKHDAMWLDSLHHELHVLLTRERDGYYAEFGSMNGLVRELTRDEPQRLVVCAQNHDQVGNRAVGDRLPADAHRVALACVLFATATPLVFMGEEYDESRPFQFFTDHTDPFIADATREGRRKEFERFSSFSRDDVPDPQAPETFQRSKLDPRDPNPFYVELLRLRRRLPRELDVRAEGSRLTLRRGAAELVLDLDERTAELHA
jgi:maltooligosyltrehalose trehalohydrolase